MKSFLKIAAFIGLVLLNGLLTSCASLNNDFECKQKPGVRCKSLSEINTMVDQEHLKNESVTNSHLNNSDSFDYFDMVPATSRTSTVLRQNEKIVPIWITPYEDSTGNYHQASAIYAVARPGYWVNDSHF